ncbi:MAG: paraquat-inducible protein A [Pseudomonadales bacterium]|nr:paraquat-inducible protein A [Pseudomonadales bacterium]
MFLDPDTYSILGSVQNLLHNGDWWLALLIAAFSIVFPVLKYGLLFIFSREPVSESNLTRNLSLLRVLGKWSMLDIFIVAITFGAANLGVLSKVQVHWGVYVYGAGVILAMLAAFCLSWLVNQAKPKKADSIAIPGTHWGRLLHGIAFICFIAGIFLPLAEIQKWLFWENSYTLASALVHFFAAGEYLLPLVLFLFVIALPILHFILTGVLRWQSSVHSKLLVATEFLDEWAMFDVYMLAMLLVMIKLSDNASVSLESGFWLLAAAALINIIDSARLRFT